MGLTKLNVGDKITALDGAAAVFLLSPYAPRDSKESRGVLIYTIAIYLAIALGGGIVDGAEKPSRDEIVATCLVLEAGGEGVDGMIAVANVISNRAHGDASKFALVALKPFQFSCFNGGKLDALIARAKRHPRWSLAAQLAESAAVGALDDVTQGATHYHAVSIAPYWAKSMTPTVRLGAHQFYRSGK